MAVLNFKDWQLRSSAGPAAAQLDHKSRQIAVTGDIPEGYSWDLLVMAPSGATDVWSLTAAGDGLAVVVTRGMVPEEGRYAVQLRGTLQSDNDTQRHTNIVQLRVLPSITAGGKWPVLPTEFSQAEARLRDIAAHPPIPGNGVWQLWNSDTGAYEDSELPLPSGVDGVTPHIGDNGNWYLGDEDTGVAAKGAKGDTGAPGIYYGTMQPTGDTHPVWIDPNGMPDELDLSLGITAATVGQIAKIAAVDASGVPTAWSPVDMPSGGGEEKEWTLIRNLTLEAQVDRVDITTDEHGNTFSLSECYCAISTQSYEDSESEVFFLPNGGWTTGDPTLTSTVKSSKSSATWRNGAVFHAVSSGTAIVSEQLPCRSANNFLNSNAKLNQAKITKLSFAGKFGAGCSFWIIGR